jgi:NADH dehydrogenase
LQALAELEVELKLGAAVASIHSGGITTTDGERVEAMTVVWTAGMEATALTRQISGERDRYGRLYVDQDLRVPTSNEVFATGDAAYAATDSNGHHAMMSCQHALRLGRSAGHNAAADLLKIQTRPYTQVNYGTCLDLGPWGSVVTEGWDRMVKFAGVQAKPLKQYVNGTLIYPPKADKKEALEAADPDIRDPDLASVLEHLGVSKFGK